MGIMKKNVNKKQKKQNNYNTFLILFFLSVWEHPVAALSGQVVGVTDS